MDFAEAYRNSIQIRRMADITPDPDFLIPNIYQYDPDLFREITIPDRLRLLAGGLIHVPFPVSVSFESLNACLLLYTELGGGRITANHSTFSVTENKLFLLDLQNGLSIRSLILPWSFKLFFLSGKALRQYQYFLSLSDGALFEIPPYSEIPRDLSFLLSLSVFPDPLGSLCMHRSLTSILTELCLAAKKEDGDASLRTPKYLAEIKYLLEHHYFEPFSLEDLENRFSISKYRLCREFSACYHLPPLKYLTKVRMEEAKKMLLTSDLKVHEISSRIGYENTNHFINLFKKEYGITPNAFRQRAQDRPAVLRSPVQ